MYSIQHAFMTIVNFGLLLQLTNGSATNGSYTLSEKSLDTPKNSCRLELIKTSIRDEVLKLIEENPRLIKYHFEIVNDHGPFSLNKTEKAMLIKPYSMVLVTDGTGHSMLALKEYFQPMSVHTLGYGVAELEVKLNQNPENCLEEIPLSELEKKLKLVILRNFGNDTSTVAIGREVCNQWIHVSGTNEGSMKYVCCKVDSGNELLCHDLEISDWIYFLFTIITILQVIFVLYSPKLLPAGGRMGSKFIDFIYKPDPPLTLNAVTVDPYKVISDDTFVKGRQFPFVQLANLKNELRCLTPGVLHSLIINKICLSVRASKIIPDGYSPVGFGKFIKQFFVRCKLRHELPALGVCCKANMLKKCNCFDVPWFKCLSLVMWVGVVILVTTPWLIRVWFFYAFEDGVRSQFHQALTDKGLNPSYQGSLVLQLTPNATIFTAIYCFIPIEGVIYMLLPSVAKRKLKYTIQISMKNMRATRRFDALITFISYMLWPLEEFGLLGVLVLPVWLLLMPVGILVLCYQVFPIVNLTMRLLINFIYYLVKFINPEYLYKCCETDSGVITRFCNQLKASIEQIIVIDKYERKSRRNMMTHVASLTMCMATMFMLLLLLVECVAFYVECVIYIIIGIILNSKNVMKYLSLIVLITWYALDCFGSVSSSYRSFASMINREIQTKVGDAVKTVAMCVKSEQKEEAFAVKPKDGGLEERMTLVTGTEGYLKWKAKRLLLFLDTEDVPYIPKDFLFKVAKLGHFACPGPVHIMYLKALIELLSITIFLGFVMLVIIAFGEANNISGANQTLATLASGFLPFVFRKFLIKPHAGPSLDTSNIAWQTTIAEAVDTYYKRWTVKDCDIGLVVKTDDVSTAEDVHNQTRILNLGSTIPDCVDMIVKIHKGIDAQDETMEFWIRKAEPKVIGSPYFWKKRKPPRKGDDDDETIEMIQV